MGNGVSSNPYIGASNVGPSSPKENRKSSVIKDDTYRKSSVMKDDRSCSEQSSSEEERRSSRKREKTRGNAQVETDTGQTVYTQVELETVQTAYTPRWQKTGSAMQMESRDPRSRPIPTACIPPGLATQRPEEDERTALPSLQLKRTALPSLQLKTTSMPEDSARPAGHAVARQE